MQERKVHDTADILDKILEAHHSDTDFVQLQVNYADWEDEKVQSRKCCEVARKYGKPIIVMCHYCPKGHSHGLFNDGDEDLVFFAVVPAQ